MAAKPETKHDRFLRLAQRRLECAKDKLRLVSQLSSSNYECKPDEAKEIVRLLDEDVRHIAEVFGVEYATRIGKSATKATNGGQPIAISLRRVSILDEIEIVKVLEHINAGRIEDAKSALRSACAGTGKKAA